MPLSWNEIRHRAIAFSKEWRGETREAAERQSFWNEFFNVFGMRRRAVASFEEPVRKLGGDWGFIDLFWPGKLIVEHTSAGQDLGKAHSQAMQYIRGLENSGRDAEAPRWLIVSDFGRIALHDLEPEEGARTFLSAATFDAQMVWEEAAPGRGSALPWHPASSADRNVRAPSQSMEFPLAAIQNLAECVGQFKPTASRRSGFHALPADTDPPQARTVI